MESQNAIERFVARVAFCFSEYALVRVRLSSPRPEFTWMSPVRAIEMRPVCIKRGWHFSFTFKYATRDEVKNFDPPQGLDYLEQLLGSFQSAYLSSTKGDWQLQTTADGPRLVEHAARVKETPSPRHDRPKQTWVGASAQDWLLGLGVTTADGRIIAQQADKHRQIARFGEILSHLARAAGWGPPAKPMPLTLADMGCGKGYLTFGVWHLFRRCWQWPVQVWGVEQRAELVELANGLARRIRADGLFFHAGQIADAPLERLDALIALHACDTATDDALLRGIRAGARLLMVSPCCHKQLRPQLGRPAPLAPLLQHGLLAGRLAEWLTDGLRALYLEWAGYETRVVEFVSSEHTPRNLMLAGVLRHPPFGRPALRQQILELKSFFAIQQHALDPLLDGPHP